jgi:anti-sigma factor RsiW
MTDPRPDELDRTRRLMMAVIDGESSAAERQELERALAGDPGLAAEWLRVSRVKEVTAAMAFSRPPDETWDGYWASVYNRTERRVAWLLVLAGLVVLLAWGLWHLVPALVESIAGETAIPVVVRVAIVAVLTGGVLLVVSVIREQLSSSSRDQYDRRVSR